MLCVGAVTLDRYRQQLVPGGCVTYAATTWAMLGGEARVLTTCGPEFPRSSLEPAIRLHALEADRTTVFTNTYDESGHRSQLVVNPPRRLSPNDLPAGWERADVLFIGPVLGECAPGGWTDACRARIAVGVQGLSRKMAADIDPGCGGRVEPLHVEVSEPRWDEVDYAFLSTEDQRHQPDLASSLAERVPVVVLTDQERGCTVFFEGRRFHVGAYPTNARDPTGAGDTFASAFLFAMATGSDSHEAACFAAACASIVIEDTGPRALNRLGEEAPQRARRLRAGRVIDQNHPILGW